MSKHLHANIVVKGNTGYFFACCGSRAEVCNA